MGAKPFLNEGIYVFLYLWRCHFLHFIAPFVGASLVVLAVLLFSSLLLQRSFCLQYSIAVSASSILVIGLVRLVSSSHFNHISHLMIFFVAVFSTRVLASSLQVMLRVCLPLLAMVPAFCCLHQPLFIAPLLSCKCMYPAKVSSYPSSSPAVLVVRSPRVFGVSLGSFFLHERDLLSSVWTCVISIRSSTTRCSVALGASSRSGVILESSSYHWRLFS